MARAAIILLLCFGGAWPVAAQETTCPEGNLLAGKQPLKRGGVSSPARLTDGVITYEGDPWESKYTSVFRQNASATYDLGASYPIVAVDLQGDNNDEYVVEISEDGESFSPLWTALVARGQGMRRRSARGLSGQGRFLRVTPTLGDGFYSVSEIQAFCQEPSPWPPSLEAKGAPKWWWTKIMSKRDHRYKLVLSLLGLFFFVALFRADRNRRAIWIAAPLALLMVAFSSYALFKAVRLAGWFSDWGVYVVAIGVLAWLLGGIWFRREEERAHRWWERGALVCVIVASAIAWLNFGAYHQARIVHYWDTYHYYIGSKYFSENGYERIYQCAIVADLQEHGRDDLGKRKIRDLIDNKLHFVAESEVLGYEQKCAEHFAPERWEAFRQDARLFRRVMGSSWWKDMLMDHGYNASPISNMVASFLSNLGWRAQVPDDGTQRLRPDDIEEFKRRMRRYAGIDLALYALSFLMIFWAFGLRACALAALVWGVGYPWAYFWTGGSFARVPWLFMAVASLCFMKKGYPLLSGFAVSWSALLRLFPAVLVGGQGASIVDRFFRRKKLAGPWLNSTDKRFIAGGFLGLLLLCGASVVMNGFEAHPQFVQNSLKHRETPLTNHMGLPTILSYRPSKVGRHTKDPSMDDPWANWKQGRKDTQHDRRWLYRALLLGMFVLLALLGRRIAPWALLSASVILIIGFFELTCYYYSFVVLMAPLAIERLRYTIALIGMTTAGMLLQFFVGWYDEQYIWETVIVLGALLYILVDLLREPLPGTSPAALPEPG